MVDEDEECRDGAPQEQAPPRERRRRWVVAGMLVLAIGLAACGGGDDASGASPSLRQVADPNPALASVPRFGTTPAQSFVGTAGASSLGLNIGGDSGNDVTAYLCDGAQVSAWFTGTVDTTGTITATSPNGAKLTARIDGSGVAGAVDGQSFTLAAAQLNSGLYRETVTTKGEEHVSGWILRNDGQLVGAETVKGKVVAGTSTNVGDTGPSTATGGTTTTAPPVAEGALRCAILGFRMGRQVALFNQEALTGTPHGNRQQQLNDLSNEMTKQGCAS
jgi:hypothetical protein